MLYNINNDPLIFFCCRCFHNRTDSLRYAPLLTDHFSHVAFCYMKFHYSSLSFLLLINSALVRMVYKRFCDNFNLFFHLRTSAKTSYFSIPAALNILPTSSVGCAPLFSHFLAASSSTLIALGS